MVLNNDLFLSSLIHPLTENLRLLMYIIDFLKHICFTFIIKIIDRFAMMLQRARQFAKNNGNLFYSIIQTIYQLIVNR